MLRTVLRMKSPFHIARQEQAPILREREVFLEHLLRQGSSLPSVRSVAWQLLNVIRLLKLTSLRKVSIDEIQRASQRWAQQQQANPLAHSYKNSATLFVYVAKKWLRFLGKLKNSAFPPVRFTPEIDQFAAWMKEDRGLSASTVRSHQSKVMLFLRWFSERHRSLTNVHLTDVDEFFIWRGAKGWTRKSACDYANSLRTFFRFTVLRGWCRSGIAEGIISPTLYGDEGLPKGPEWSQVQQLLHSVRGSKPSKTECSSIAARSR
jgi:integrase/recombinase XerD